MSEAITPVGIDETKKLPDLKTRALEDERKYNNFFAALRQGGDTITIAIYEMNKADFGDVMDKPSARDHELSRLIKSEMASHNISVAEIKAGEALMMQAARGEEVSEEQAVSLTDFLDTIEEMFDNVTGQEFEGEQFTAEEVRR